MDLRRRNGNGHAQNVVRGRPGDAVEPIRETPLTPEERRELHEVADLILESDQADLLRALLEVLYRYVMNERQP